MTHPLKSSINQFFDEQIDLSRPLLLGLSGGPDSICLLTLLLEWQRPIQLHLVHVDHGWRKESALEAEKLQALADVHCLPFHSTRLQPENYRGNLEMESRWERFDFFTKVQQEVGAQGILLGHHADDQAETVLKRVLEGASLPYLSGIMPVSSVGALRVMRPLLSATKKQILTWLAARSMSYFHDATNLDERFLRAKMRGTIFPFLRDSFGKEFDRNLCEIAHEASELRSYLDCKITPFLQKAVESNCGLLLEEAHSMDPFELSYLIRRLCKQEDVHVSRWQVSLATSTLTEKRANTWVVTGERALMCDRGRAFFLRYSLQDVEGMRPLVLGEQKYGDWKIAVKLVDDASRLEVKNSWRDVWKGSVSSLLPVGDYFGGKAEANCKRQFLASEKPAKVLNRFLNEKKVPHFLISKIPAIFCSGSVVEDFLSEVLVENRVGRMLYVSMERETRGFKDLSIRDKL